jgi:hypothetical protein
MRTSRGSRSYRRQLRVIPLPTRRLQLEVLEARFCLALTVPAFSSLPGANQTIYLDFDGQITQNTAWNKLWSNPKINSPAYNIDGNATSFSPQELANIESAWKRVAEDYFPFQVNVTTVDPGVEALRRTSSSDKQWGVRVVITSDTEHTGAGGIGYVGSFTWNSDTPVFVYTTGEKSIAEAASHEVGHSLGLAHDGSSSSEYYAGHGSGDTSWAPLMGVGYYKNVTTWSRGEYKGANNNTANANYGKGSDDLAIITGSNGFGYRGDDFGNETFTAGSLPGPNVNTAGVISTTSDVDVFRFQAGVGTMALTISPFTPGPNLDVKAELINGQGVTIAVSDSPTVLSASFNLKITTAGTYYLRISGVGTGNPLASTPTGYTDYASLGRYFITGSCVAGSASGGGLPGLPSLPGGPSAPQPPFKKSPTSQLSLGASGSESTFFGFVSPTWDGVGNPPKPELDPWSDFEGLDGDFPQDGFLGSKANDGLDSRAAAIVQLTFSSGETSESSLRDLSVFRPISFSSTVLNRAGDYLAGPFSIPVSALEKASLSSSSEHDQIFEKENVDWTSLNNRVAQRAVRLLKQTTAAASESRVD